MLLRTRTGIWHSAFETLPLTNCRFYLNFGAMPPFPVCRCLWLLAAAFLIHGQAGADVAPSPVLLDDRFELPPDFHIYRAASPELTGGSYDVAFDGQGRLLVGDGNAVRRLEDTNQDGVYDRFEVLVSGLGWRGPQGLLVWGDRLYAVGGDGLQLYDGYTRNKLVHRGRLGAKLGTGGDHDTHTILRGYEGWLYLMAGNGAGIRDRTHITESNSPMLWEREASVFRLDPDGNRWECVAAGGRNPPNLGLNYLGDLFSFDSDMEWHVGLPWYKPVRLSHWAVGSDQGWQDVGAYPAYYIDCVPHVVAEGRGSPNWGVFYEHQQLPGQYRNAYLVCDYRWKRESNDRYATPGRLVAFFLDRAGADWKARMETLVRPKEGARDALDRPINFALVDIDVAPDGSLLLSDHNQGLWRVFYAPKNASPPIPPLAPDATPLPRKKADLLEAVLKQPQPLAEWSRLRMDAMRTNYGAGFEAGLQRIALQSRRPLDQRLRAMQHLAPGFARMEKSWLNKLAADREAEVRSQAAWFLGLRGGEESLTLLLRLFEDKDSLVRRRVAEALVRFHSARAIPALIDHMADPNRLTRFICMNALAHFPAADWFESATGKASPQIRMRALVALLFRKEPPPPEVTRRVIRSLLENRSPSDSAEDRLDLMRVLALFQKPLETDAETKQVVTEFLLDGFPADDAHARWEQVRLLGLFGAKRTFGQVLALLKTERDQTTQFHIAQSLARLPGGWTAEEENSAMDWFETTQRGWFAQFEDKGVEFPHFWSLVLSDFAAHHGAAFLQRAERIELTSLLGRALMDVLAERDPTGGSLIEFYRKQTQPEAQVRLALAMGRVPQAAVSQFIREQLIRATHASVREALLQSLAAQPVDENNVPWLMMGLSQFGDETARASASAILRHQPALTPALADACMQRFAESPRLFHLMEKLLVTLSGKRRVDFRPDADLNRRPEEPLRQAALGFWKTWYLDRFGRAFAPRTNPALPEKSDADLYRFLLGETVLGGSAERGGAIYERLQCHTCHGGGAAPGREGRLFGPDLAGVTRRLTRTALADALTYPSKEVADRFKAFLLEKKDDTALTGFIVEQNDDVVTFADAQQVHRVARSEIARLAPQTQSLMPERLLNGLSEEETRDLLAFLDNLGVSPPKP